VIPERASFSLRSGEDFDLRRPAAPRTVELEGIERPAGRRTYVFIAGPEHGELHLIEPR
jgi:hypothetical protein